MVTVKTPKNSPVLGFFGIQTPKVLATIIAKTNDKGIVFVTYMYYFFYFWDFGIKIQHIVSLTIATKKFFVRKA